MLTLQFVPYAEIESLSSHARIQKLLDIIKEEKIVLLEGRLTKTEEAELIKKTMEEIDVTQDQFRGIELSVIQPPRKNKNRKFMDQLKIGFINMILGDRQGLTVVGPVSLVKEIKQDPDKIQLFIDNYSNGKKKKNSRINGKRSILKNSTQARLNN
jgi:hypothetical protein